MASRHCSPRRLSPPTVLVGAVLTAFLIAVAITLTASPTLAASADAGWSAEEQQFVYLLNRARWSPGAVTAAAGLPAGTFLPQPPLAINASLAASAQARSDEMAAYDYFAHQSPITGRWPNEVARASGYDLPGWWPDEANNIESLHRGSPDPARVLQSFIESPNHRNHVMGQDWFGTHREIGVGVVLADRIWAIHTASREDAPLFLTGVAYQDRDGDGGMDLGEGLAGVTVTVDGRATTTTAGGGWAIAVAEGAHLVEAAGAGFEGRTAVTVQVGQYNVEVDFISDAARSAQPRALVLAYALCGGRQPTILGTSEDDVITGTGGPDVIHGLGGNDTIHGLGGDDLICGGPGDDQLWGDEGNDLLISGGGRDTLTGGAGSDELRGRIGLDSPADAASGDRVVLQ
jgi:serralysin